MLYTFIFATLYCKADTTIIYTDTTDYVGSNNHNENSVIADSTKVGNTGMEEQNSIFRRIINYFEKSNKASSKKFDISVIGGPRYSSDTKFGIGIVAAGLYNSRRLDSSNILDSSSILNNSNILNSNNIIDNDTHTSNVSLYGTVTTAGYYTFGIDGIHYFKRDIWRINYSTYFLSFPSNFWGIGYYAGDNNNNKSKYVGEEYTVKATFLLKVLPNLLIGPITGYSFTIGKRFTNPALIEGRPKISRSFCYGLAASYDSRDLIENAYSGMFFEIKQQIYNYFTCKPFFKTDITANYYKQIWRGCILALDAFSSFGYGSTPLMLMAKVGGSSRMRGYYEGRYRDDNMISFQAEFRQRVYNRNGIVVWFGAGNLWGKDRFNRAHTLPTYGLGYRWEFKKRINLRLDYGIGRRGQSSFMFGINEAF